MVQISGFESTARISGAFRIEGHAGFISSAVSSTTNGSTMDNDGTAGSDKNSGD